MKFNNLHKTDFLVKVEDEYTGYTYKVLDTFQVYRLTINTTKKKQIKEIFPTFNDDNHAIILFVNGKSECIKRDENISLIVFKVLTTVHGIF